MAEQGECWVKAGAGALSTKKPGVVAPGEWSLRGERERPTSLTPRLAEPFLQTSYAIETPAHRSGGRGSQGEGLNATRPAARDRAGRLRGGCLYAALARLTALRPIPERRYAARGALSSTSPRHMRVDRAFSSPGSRSSVFKMARGTKPSSLGCQQPAGTAVPGARRSSCRRSYWPLQATA